MRDDLKSLLDKTGNRREGIGAAVLLDRVERQLAGEPTTGLVIAPESRYSGWLVAVVSATAVAVLTGAIALLVWDGDRGAVGATSTIAPPDTTIASEPAPTGLPATEAPPATYPVPPPHAAALASGWSDVLHTAYPALWDVASLPGVGFVAAGLGAQLLVSADGVTWTDTSARIAADSGFLAGAAASDEAFVVVGGTCEELECPQEQGIWTSRDGVFWERVPADGEILETCHGETWFECFVSVGEVAGHPGGFLATGWRAGKPSVDATARDWFVWTSDDGTEWTRLATPDLADLGYPEQQEMLGDPGIQTDLVLRPLGRIGGRFVLWVQFAAMGGGSNPLEANTCCENWQAQSMMAVSVDGQSWQPVALFDDPDGSLTVTSAYAADDRLVAVGSEDGLAAAWSTGDAVDWVKSEMIGDVNAGRLISVTGAWAGYVAIGETNVVEYGTGDAEPEWSEAGPVLWQSDDGTSWVRIDTADLDATMFRSIAGSGSSLIAVGGHWPPENENGFDGIWLHSVLP